MVKGRGYYNHRLMINSNWRLL